MLDIVKQVVEMMFQAGARQLEGNFLRLIVL